MAAVSSGAGVAQSAVSGAAAAGAAASRAAASSAATPAETKGRWAIAVHGGAGSGEWEHMPDAREAAYHAALDRALKAGAAVLDRNGAPMDAVEAALHVLEDDPLFNAGKGAVFNERGENEMDASIMDGATLKAGAVAAVHATKNPISLARAVMEKTPYVMMVGRGADEFFGAGGVAAGAAELLLDGAAMDGARRGAEGEWSASAAAAGGGDGGDAEGGCGQDFATAQMGDDGCGGAGPGGECGGGDVDGRDAGEDAGAGGRLADYWCGDVCE